MGWIIPEGYLRLRDAIHTIAELKYAGLDATEAVIRTREAGYDVRFSIEQLEASTNTLWELIDATHKSKERLEPVYVWAEQSTTARLLRLEPSMLAAVPHARRYRGGTLEYLRPGSGLFLQVARWFRPPFDDIALMLKTEDVSRLARKFRAAVRGARKPSKSPKPVGRPSQRKSIQTAIIDIEERGKWNARTDSLGRLIQLLGRPPYNIAASESTIRRALTGLTQGGHDRLQRPQKQRPARSAPLNPR